jgi:lipopolysaccharide export system protein LptA
MTCRALAWYNFKPMKDLLQKTSRMGLPGTALLLLLLPVSGAGLAADRDRDQPINIEADRATLNEETGNSVYEGNVYVRQGTIVLQGDGEQSDRQAEAARIEFHARDDRVILLENARVWQAEDKELRSDRIVFDLKSNTVDAGSNKPGERVRITLQPGKQDESSATQQ